ncbi:hypothetical protein AAG906_025396 [Vitis piasezkii]
MGACKVPPISCFLLPTPPNCKTPIPIRQKLNPSSPNRRGLLISTSSLLVVLLPLPLPPLLFPPSTPLLEKGRELQAQGDFERALQYFTQVVNNYKDFAFSDYARVGRALALYEVGDRQEAIAEMEDVSISLKGYPEVHAALAAALYADKHAPLLAENQFTIATLLDPHYTDIAYVRETKHWPPSLISSLQHFITLS